MNIRGTIKRQVNQSPLDFALAIGQISQIRDTLDQLLKDYRDKLQSVASDTQKERDAITNQFQSDLRALLSRPINKGEKGDRGEQGLRGPKGETGDIGEIGARGPRGLDGKNGKDGRDGSDGKNADPIEVINQLVKILINDKRLKIDHIDGLRETISSIRNIAAVGGGMRGGQGEWKVVSLAGAINSVNKIFTASAANPPAKNSHHVMLNYVEQNPLADYTITFSSGTITVTYTNAPDISLSGLPHYLRYL